jgi:hypothetical protein
MSAERPDSSDPDTAWTDARADEIVAFCRDTLKLLPSQSVVVLSVAIGFVIARSDNEWTDKGPIAKTIRQAFLADRAGDIASSPNAR